MRLSKEEYVKTELAIERQIIHEGCQCFTGIFKHNRIPNEVGGAVINGGITADSGKNAESRAFRGKSSDVVGVKSGIHRKTSETISSVFGPNLISLLA